MIMFMPLRRFIRISLTLAAIISIATLVYAGNDPHEEVFSSKDIIMILFGLLQTVFMGIGVWLIANDRELFTRMKDVEKKVDIRESLCEERWDSGNHPQRRVNDK